ncbi:MAG TPA: S1 RNA-binding domain-containing protein [Candidatus Moranbacteria bacterium]|nr:S1 RNA-binding domain-containing protein [Candidatus Moranbacteria bacterium]
MTDILEKLAKEVDKLSDENITALPKEDKSSKKKEKKAPKMAEEENSPMDKLLSQNPISFPQIGENIAGKVIEVSSNEIYLDLAPFGTGIVLGKEIKDGMGVGKIKIGDEVSAIVTDLENEDGYIELSIREASYEKAWEDIESKRDTQEKIATKIISANKGGLLVEINGISGFLPVSQLSSKNYPRVEDGDKNKILSMLKKLAGKELEVRILDADRESQKLIVSEKAATSEKDREVISNLSVGDVISGEISGVVDFGAFIKFSPQEDSEETSEEEKLEGLVHISELAWQLIEDPRSIVKVGDRVEAKIIGIDADKISLSIRALQKDPWSEVEKKYKAGDIVSGTVHKINPFGAFVYLDKDIHGLAHVSEMSEAYPGKNLDELIKTGSVYDWKILSIEAKTHRMGLVLADKKSQKKEKAEKKETKKEEKKEKGETKKTKKKTKKEEEK